MLDFKDFRTFLYENLVEEEEEEKKKESGSNKPVKVIYRKSIHKDDVDAKGKRKMYCYIAGTDTKAVGYSNIPGTKRCVRTDSRSNPNFLAAKKRTKSLKKTLRARGAKIANARKKAMNRGASKMKQKRRAAERERKFG